MLWKRILEHAQSRGSALALRDREGTLTYAALTDRVELIGSVLPDRQQSDPAEPGARIALLCTAGRDWASAFLAVLAAGHVAVPLATMHPPAEWHYTLQDADCSLVLVSAEWAERIQPTAALLGLELRTLPAAPLQASPQRIGQQAAAVDACTPVFIIYTSGSTGKPKGVLHTQGSLQAQVQALSEAWAWRAGDGILNVLPLHHIHGMVNIYASALWNGAAIREMHGFDAQGVWTAFGESLDPEAAALGKMPKGQPASTEAAPAARFPTLFMAVPTVYQKLLQHAQGLSPEAKAVLRKSCGALRLMVSGSAALPVPLLESWEALTGQRLLERYGMSEIGMGLSQLLNGTRYPGTVGMPLPGVECRIRATSESDVPQAAQAVREANVDAVVQAKPVSGELLVRGPALFARYWMRPEASAAAFDGAWFQTGDVVERYTDGPMAGHYRILGRSSVDILKSGGYKVSALEVEAALLAHPYILEAAVVGLEDPQWGERIAAALVLDRAIPACAEASEAELQERWRSFLSMQLAPYKIPRAWKHVEALPRNALGKVLKPRLKKEWAQGRLA